MNNLNSQQGSMMGGPVMQQGGNGRTCVIWVLTSSNLFLGLMSDEIGYLQGFISKWLFM